MAEEVQAVLDGMVPALRDLMNRGFFSEEEIHAIVSKRRTFEYLLKRRTARKSDFFRYIEYEMQLERLRSLRFKKRLPDLKKEKHAKQRLGDYHIVQNIHSLFNRMKRKWREDLSIYLQHAEFARKSSSYKVLSKIYAEALQFHPREPKLWIEAASNEYFGDENRSGEIGPARVLLQRGLRMNPGSKELFAQYFALEWHYLQKLKARKMVLKDEDKTEEEEGNADLPLIIYRNAIKAIPDDVQFHLEFLRICQLFPDTQHVQDHIISSIQRDFDSSPAAWIARAQYAFSQQQETSMETGFLLAAPSTEQDTQPSHTDIIDQAVQSIPFAEMYIQAVDFLQSLPSPDQQYLTDLFQKALSLDLTSSPELASRYANHLTESKEKYQFLLQATIHCNPPYKSPSQLELWMQLASLVQQHPLLGEYTPAQIYQKALDYVPVSEEAHLQILMQFMDHLLSIEDDLRIAQTWDQILLLVPGTECMRDLPALSPKYLQYSLRKQGIEAARKMYERILFQILNASNAPMFAEFIRKCMDLERELPNKKRREFQKRMARIYNAVEKVFDSKDDVYFEFMELRGRDVGF